MAMAPQERSKPLHNFSLPCLKWGHQRLLRCVKVTDNNHNHNHNNNHNHQLRSSPSIPNGFQSKNTTNIDSSKNHKRPNQTQQNLPSPDHRLNKRLKLSSSPAQEEERERETHNDPARPWNLRTRRAACKAPTLKIEEKRNAAAVVIDSPRRNSEIVSPRKNESLFVKRHSVEITMKERVKFSVSLLKEEIDEDFMEIARIRPPRRPKKRPRIVQKYLDSIFPGLWLTEVTADSYKVAEIPDS